MPSVSKRITIIAAAILFLAIAGTTANKAEELVVSKTGAFMTISGNTAGVTGTPFGFWIWCAFHASPASLPVTYQGAQVCSGSMYFYALGVPQHTVSAFSITEGANNSYTFSLVVLNAKTQQPDFTCVRSNDCPTK